MATFVTALGREWSAVIAYVKQNGLQDIIDNVGDIDFQDRLARWKRQCIGENQEIPNDIVDGFLDILQHNSPDTPTRFFTDSELQGIRAGYLSPGSSLAGSGLRFLVFPIHNGERHWLLAIFDTETRFLTIHDSSFNYAAPTPPILNIIGILTPYYGAGIQVNNAANGFKQSDGRKDCGILTCMSALFVTYGLGQEFAYYRRMNCDVETEPTRRARLEEYMLACFLSKSMRPREVRVPHDIRALVPYFSLPAQSPHSPQSPTPIDQTTSADGSSGSSSTSEGSQESGDDGIEEELEDGVGVMWLLRHGRWRLMSYRMAIIAMAAWASMFLLFFGFGLTALAIWLTVAAIISTLTFMGTSV